MSAGRESYFAYFTTVTYWALVLCWTLVLVVYWRDYRRLKTLSPLVGILLVVIFIDGTRTLVESAYFGIWYTAGTGLLPRSLHDLLSEPHYFVLPKTLNVVAALMILGVLGGRWARQFEAELERQRRVDRMFVELQEVQRAKEDLTQMIVHDMRTPLTSILTGLQLAATDSSPQSETRELTELAHAGARRLLDMVNDLLEINRIESGEMPLEPKPLPALHALQEAAAVVAPLAREKRIDLQIASTDANAAVDADPEKIHRVLVNLLGNAIKFTPPDGRITAGAERVPGEPKVRFFVADTGEGIPTEHQARIFDKFYQVESRREGRRMSTGLGLTFCKLAVEAHGGAIGVESAPGHGSTFWFTLPATDGVLEPRMHADERG